VRRPIPALDYFLLKGKILALAPREGSKIPTSQKILEPKRYSEGDFLLPMSEWRI